MANYANKEKEDANTLLILPEEMPTGSAASEMEEAIKRMEEKLKLWDEKLLFMAKNELVGMQARRDLKSRIDTLKARRAMAQAKFDEFKAAGSEKWENFKTAIEGALKDIENAFQEMTRD
jgi:hypothetical protein